MKRTTFWVLTTVGIVIFGFLIVQLFSLYIYGVKSSVRVEDNFLPSYMSEDSISYDPYQREIGSTQDSATYNDDEGSKVQKTGSINFLVRDLDSAVDNVQVVNVKYSGVVTNIYDYGRGNDRTVQLTVKVPVKGFEEYYEELRKLDGEVTYANIDTNDLTEQYIDITSRLENLKSVEGQLVGILKDASSVQDILAVQKELNTVRGDIESYEAQKRYFDNQTDYSYVSLTFNIDKEGLNISDKPWKPLGEFRVALNALVYILKGIVNVGVWVLVFSPIILIPVGIVLYITKRKSK